MRIFPLSTADHIARARAVLATNETITVYDFENGVEFNRRRANPFLGIRRSMEKMTESVARMGDQFQELSASFAAALRNPTE